MTFQLGQSYSIDQSFRKLDYGLERLRFKTLNYVKIVGYGLKISRNRVLKLKTSSLDQDWALACANGRLSAQNTKFGPKLGA